METGMFLEFPCALCGAGCPGLICPGCDGDLPRLGPSCILCGMPAGTRVCIACQITPPCWDCLIAPFSFAFPIDKIIHQFKYQGSVYWGVYLAREMVRHGLALEVPLPGALIPVPAHRRRLAERGFNQAVELARGIGRELDIPVLTGGVKRIGSHPRQVGLNARHRRKNVKGAFLPVGIQPAASTVAIVDDILTTGATARELAQVLLRSGAGRIQVWVVARTPIAPRPG